MILHNSEWEDKIEINLYLKCSPHRSLCFLGVYDGWGEGLHFQIHLKSSLCEIGTGIGKEVSDG